MDIVNALCKGFESIIDIVTVFKTNKDCIKFLEALIWDGVPVSPFDKSSKVYKCKGGRYKCKNTGKYFTVTTGTVFEGTKIPLTCWFLVVFLVNANRGSIASTTIARTIKISQKTAWYMLQKVRSAMQFENENKLSGTVEADEYYAGGSYENMHYGEKLKAKAMGTYGNKTPVHGFVERGGNAVIKIIPNVERDTLCAGVLHNVERGSILYTDENQKYDGVNPFYKRSYVTHSKGKYVIDGKTHTNSIESVWACFDRSLRTHIRTSKKYLQNYAHETTFRYNTRKMKPYDATIWFLQNIEATRITWKDIRDGKYRQCDRNQERAA